MSVSPRSRDYRGRKPKDEVLPRASRHDAGIVYHLLQRGPATIHEMADALEADTTEGAVIVPSASHMGHVPQFYSLGLAYSAIDYMRGRGVVIVCRPGVDGSVFTLE